ncbi:MAG: hypothetical protein M1497_10975 [Nitrospirae bacterium]|nr:hypothetical protein [Nitrospirota bacterium]
MEQRKILLGIFLFSFSSLSYEIALTRVFSISLWYHFAFLVITLAMLGIGASGTVLSLYPGLRASSRPGEVSEKIALYGLLLGAAITLSYLLSNRLPFDPVRLPWERVQLLYLFLYCLFLSVPFFSFGLSVSTGISAASGKSGLLYGADFTGAGAGSVALLFVLSKTAPENAILLASSIASAGAFLIGKGKTRAASVFLIASNLLLFATPDLIAPRISPYKGLQIALKYPGAEHIRTYHGPFSRVDVFRSPAVRFAPGLSLRYLDELPEQTGLSVDGGKTNAITGAGNEDALAFLKFLPPALAYEMRKRDDVLVLDPEGGLDVLLARHYHSGNISSVESNPLVTQVIGRDFNDFSQGIYDKNTWTGMGRSWLKTRNEQFDLIDMPLTGTSPAGAFGVAEDYRFTAEAFKEYLGHLKKDGILCIHLFIVPPPRVELRLLNTLVTSMEEMGIGETENKIISIRSWGTVCLLAKREPLTSDEIRAVRKFSKEMRFDLVLLPGIREEEANLYVKMPSNDYFNAFRKILDPASRASFERDYLFDIAPVRDDNPFFHYYLKLRNLGPTYRVMGEKWQFFIEEGYLLPIVFLQVLILSGLFIALPAVSRREAEARVEKTQNERFTPIRRLTSLLYFAFLGVGYMFVEIPLIQKMILPLENPSYAVSSVLTSMLVSSGAGSLLSQRVGALRRPCAVLAAAAVIVGYSVLLPSISDAVSSQPMPLRIVSAFAFLVPLAFLMGIPFPTGMRTIGEKSPDMIPWAWAVNGCLSVLAPILAVMLAMAVGFKAVFWMGAAAYFLAFLTFPMMKSPARNGSSGNA